MEEAPLIAKWTLASVLASMTGAAGGLLAGLLAAAVLFSQWLAVLFQPAPSSEAEFWRAALGWVVSISVTIFTGLGGLLWRDWRNQLTKMQGKIDEFENKIDGIQEVQVSIGHVLGILAAERGFQNEDLRKHVNQLIYGSIIQD